MAIWSSLRLDAPRMYRFSHAALALLIALMLGGCEQVPQQADTDYDTCVSATSGIADHARHCSLQAGNAELRCGDRWVSLPEISPLAFAELRLECSDRYGLALAYEGEIDGSLLTLIRTVDGHVESWQSGDQTYCRLRPAECEAAPSRPLNLVLLLDSAGGDAETALEIGDILSRRPWTVLVARRDEVRGNFAARCYSACIFILASARNRIIAGQVGIHRLYPAGSRASSRDELATQLEDIILRSKAFMRRNGIAPSIVDDMMTVPSEDIRLLTFEELDEYGMGTENAAQLDLERLNLERGEN